MSFFKKVKGFLLKPSKTFDSTKSEKLSEAIIYYAGIAAIYLASSAVLYYLVLQEYEREDFLSLCLNQVFLLFISLFFFGVLLHIYVYIIGGRKGITQTIKAVIYSSTPGLLLGWTILLIPLILPIWSLALVIIGIRQLHEITIERAFLAVFFPMIVVVVILASIIAQFVA